MPIIVESGRVRLDREFFESDAIEIGLLNNLSDAGLEGGERRFVDRLSRACGSRLVRLRLFSLPSIDRGAVARTRIEKIYTPFDELFRVPLDGLIVTGAEPRAARLRDEPFWSELTNVIDWAERNTRSTIWSCLAAHAAVLHLDGIERYRMPAKLSGVYGVERAGAHPLLGDAPRHLLVPHSRYNALAEADLLDAGYDILTGSPSVGVDTFVRSGRSQFVFLQGHPEYDREALVREYRRDVLRFLDGTDETYPNVPAGIFDAETIATLEWYGAEARRAPARSLFVKFPARAHRASGSTWNEDYAEALFANWLTALQVKTQEHAA